MKQIELTRNKIALVDDNDYIHVLLNGKWYYHKMPHTSYCLAVRCLKINNHYVLESLAEFITGHKNVEYIDDNTLNNQKNNLRILDNELNERN